MEGKIVIMRFFSVIDEEVAREVLIETEEFFEETKKYLRNHNLLR